MDILEIIKKRRSVRNYTKERLLDIDLEKILESAIWAPSGLNNQPWRFLIIKNTAEKDGLAKFTKYGKIIKAAAVSIVVCLNLRDSYNRDKDLMAIGACIQNICLCAHGLGLGACWLGEILNRKSQVAKYLCFDKNLEIMAVITLGYPDKAITKSHRKPLKEFII